jgi:hypothetical protein
MPLLVLDERTQRPDADGSAICVLAHPCSA